MKQQDRLIKKIPVRIGWELLLIISLPIFLPIILYLNNNNIDFKEFWIPIFIFGFVLFIIFSIRYEIIEQQLIIKNSIFQKTIIPISDIKKIEKTWNAISSPAPSIIGRIEIYYGKESIVISPQNIHQFYEDILNINPNVDLIY